MTVLRFLLRVIGWLIVAIFQFIVSYFIIFLFSIVFAGVDRTTRSGWLVSLVGIWVSFVIGVSLVGLAYLYWLRKDMRLLVWKRVLATAIGALIPLAILLPIGFSVPVGDTGSSFYDLVTVHWQPILVQAAIFAAIVGFYVPGLFSTAVSSQI
jgi:hypothetical protein